MAANMVVRTNVFALNAHRNMKNVGLQQRQASNRLSSGYRINSAADDAAGLAISENMRAQIRGLDQASRNAQDGQAMLLTTEGGLEEIGNMLQRTRELMVQAANDTNTQDQRGLIEQEIGQLGREILSMQNRVEFNTNRVLAMGPGMATGVITQTAEMQKGAHNMAVIGGALAQLHRDVVAAIDIFSELDPGAAAPEVGTAANLAMAAANTTPGGRTAQFGGFVTGALGGTPLNADAANTAVSTLAAGASAGEILSSLHTRLGEVTTAINALNTTGGGNQMREAFASGQTDIRTHVNASTTTNNIAFFQVGANASQGINFDFETVSRAVTAAGWTVAQLAPAMASPSAGSGIGNGVRITPFISALDASIDDISAVRANLGAVQNRMDYTMRSLDISSENLSDSESRVRNADIAREMMRFTMTNVLQQAAVSMLAQANQLPQNLLQLLR